MMMKNDKKNDEKMIPTNDTNFWPILCTIQ